MKSRPGTKVGEWSDKRAASTSSRSTGCSVRSSRNPVLGTRKSKSTGTTPRWLTSRFPANRRVIELNFGHRPSPMRLSKRYVPVLLRRILVPLSFQHFQSLDQLLARVAGLDDRVDVSAVG